MQSAGAKSGLQTQPVLSLKLSLSNYTHSEPSLIDLTKQTWLSNSLIYGLKIKLNFEQEEIVSE